ncbi:MAG: DUF4230 domain-containing protein [Polyangiaceae bacterium]|nr:DUF4230 domain-containing protein [Polyangiaceae bacterium]
MADGNGASGATTDQGSARVVGSEEWGRPGLAGSGPSRPRVGRGLAVLVGVGALCLLAGGLLGATLFRGAPEPSPTPTASVVVRPTPHFAAAVRDLAELATVEQTLGRVIDVSERQQSWGTLGFTVEDKLLFVAHGQVRAGVDLLSLRDEDVKVDPEAGRVRIVLPPPRILTTRLDNQQSYVHARSKDWLATRAESLESRARQEAESTLERAAVDAGILGQARRNARTVVTALVRQLGYANVSVVFSDETGGAKGEGAGSP